MKTSFSLETREGLRLSHTVDNGKPYTRGSIHRLTPEQFTTLFDAFSGEDDHILDVNSANGNRKVRVGTIDLGGLMVTIFADVPAHEVDPNQLSMLDA